MNTPSLAISLSEAHLARASAAVADLRHAATAPALFKPEFIAQRRADYARAMSWAGYWQSQVVAR